MKKVLLLSMPYGALERPALGLSLLKSVLEDENISCDVRYLTFPFAEMIGAENYQWMCYELPYTAFAGDWSFTTALYGDKYDARQEEYISEVLQKNWKLDNETVQRILYIKSYIPNFIEYCLNSIEWKEYSIVGFTSTFEQNIASLALAKRVKNLYPEITSRFSAAQIGKPKWDTNFTGGFRLLIIFVRANRKKLFRLSSKVFSRAKQLK